MSEWVNELPFAWLLIGVLALSYIAATAVYTRFMMLVIDRRGRTVAKQVRADSTTIDADSPAIEPAPPQRIAVAITAGPSADNTIASNPHGTEAGWDHLTSGDVERVKRVLAARRAEALVRHAEELKQLDAEQAEIDAIERAINSFAMRYGRGTRAVPSMPHARG